MDVRRSINRMGKIALVTGSTRGIGKSIAEMLLKENYEVYLHYCMNEEIALETYRDFKKMDYKVNLLSGDISNESDIKEMFQTVEKQSGSLTVLVNNAASGVHKKIEDVRKKDWDYTFSVNARGTFLCSKYARPLMQKSEYQYRSIVNIISTGSQKYIPGYTLVGGTKAYIENLTKYLACEFSEYGINVNAVSGGLVNTESINFFLNKNEIINEAKKRLLGKRMVELEDIANVVSFLCTEKAEMIRGQTIIVDGGTSLI